MTQIGVRALAAWPLLVAEILILGTAAFALLLAQDAQSEEVANALTALWRGLGVVAVLFSPLALLVGTANMGDVSLRTAIPFLPQVIRETHFGRIWSWSFPLALALLIIPWTPGRGRAKTLALGLVAGTLLLLLSFSSHAIDRGALAVIVYFIHEVAAALWIGAILGCGLARCAEGSVPLGCCKPRRESRAWRDGPSRY
jgi:putative copper export protein